jgi:hypothetical protein
MGLALVMWAFVHSYKYTAAVVLMTIWAMALSKVVWT